MHGSSKQKHGTWTEEEDRLLAQWQAHYGNRWAEVCKHIPGKNGQQCAQRWRHRVNPDIRREKWTEAEDRKLAALVVKHGHSWAEIARNLPGRTDQQCMGRWRRHVDPTLKRDGWEPAEDEQLAELVEEYGTCWSDISKLLAGRSAHQCRLRWCQLTGAEQPSKSSRSGRSASKSSSSSSSAQQHQHHQHHQQQQSGRQEQQGEGFSSRRLSTAGVAADGSEEAAAEDSGPSVLLPHAGSGRRPRSCSARAARRLSTVSEVGMSGDGSEEDSPVFTLRKTTARTARRMAAACNDAPASGPMAAAAGAAAAGPETIPRGPAAPAAAELAAASLGLASTPDKDTAAETADMEVCEEPPASRAQALPHPHQQRRQQEQQQVPSSLAPTGAARNIAAAPAAAGPLFSSPPQSMAAHAGSEEGGGASVAASGDVAAAACAQPAVAPKRPRGRPHVYMRPLELPAAEGPEQETPEAVAQGEDESPALTQALGPSLDLLSPSRTLSHAPPPAQPPIFTPPSSVRKRALPPSRMAAFGPRLPPVAIPEQSGTPGMAAEVEGTSPGDVTPTRPPSSLRCFQEEGEGAHGLAWGLTPTLLTLLSSPQPPSCGGMDPLVSPQFGELLTPEWAKRDRSQRPATDGWAERRRPGSGIQASQAATSLDFTLLGTSPKKPKTESGDGSAAAGLPGSTVAAPWLNLTTAAACPGTAATVAAAATAGHLLLPDSVGRSALAAALQQGLGLESTAKTGPPEGLNLAGMLTGLKGAPGAGAQEKRDGGEPLTSANVRVQLRSLLELV